MHFATCGSRVRNHLVNPSFRLCFFLESSHYFGIFLFNWNHRTIVQHRGSRMRLLGIRYAISRWKEVSVEQTQVRIARRTRCSNVYLVAIAKGAVYNVKVNIWYLFYIIYNSVFNLNIYFIYDRKKGGNRKCEYSIIQIMKNQNLYSFSLSILQFKIVNFFFY